MTSGIAPIESTPTTTEVATWLNETLLPVMDGLLRTDNSLQDHEIRARHLHDEVGGLFRVLTAHLDNGVNVLAECRIATIGNHGLSGLAAIDGVTPIAGNRVLVRANTDATENGVYIASAGVWTRAADADAMDELGYCLLYVDEGDTLAASIWVCDAGTTGTIGTVDVPWKRLARSNLGPQGPTGSAGADGADGADGDDGAPGPGNVITVAGPTNLAVGAVADGSLLRRVGATAVGITIAALEALLAAGRLRPLTIENESLDATYGGYTCMVATLNDGVILFGGAAGKYGKFNWTTRVWDEGTCTGAATQTYTEAVYVPSIDAIWATNGVKVHLIDPTTMVATDLTPTTGILLAVCYNPVSSKMYGFVASTSDLLEMDPTAGTILRTFTYAAASSGMLRIAAHPTTGDLIVVTANDGSGDAWAKIPYLAFNAASYHVYFAGPLAYALGAHDRILIDEDADVAYVTCDSQVKGQLLAITAGTTKVTSGRNATNGARVGYSENTRRFYHFYGTNRLFVARLNPDTSWLDADASAQLVTNVSGHAMLDCCIDLTNGSLYVLANNGQLLRLTP